MNGPEVLSLIKHSIKLPDRGLNQLRSNALNFGHFYVNLLSRLALEFEHLHSLLNHKQVFRIMLQYARSYSASVKKSIKFLTQCVLLHQ